MGGNNDSGSFPSVKAKFHRRSCPSSINRPARRKLPSPPLSCRPDSSPFAAAKVSRAASTFHPQLANLFVRDAEKAIAALMEIHGHQYRRDNDMRTFVTTTHAMKSALANIGETELAATARALEQAGREADMAVISARTPDFIEALRQMAAQIAALEEPGAGAVDEDPAYLREKLRVIETACAAYDRKAAKDALKELRQKAWSRPTTEGLDAIAGHLLHSDFEEAAAVAKQL